jgi:hypothetical protein
MKKLILILFVFFVVSLMSCKTTRVNYNGNGVGMVPKCGKYKEYRYKKQKTYKSRKNIDKNKAIW